MSTQGESRWRLSSPGNRIMWAAVAAFIVLLATQAGALALVIGLVVFLVLTAMANASRRR